jgi:hypothetical protein
MSGFGLGTWGTSAWGYGVPAPLTMVDAYATSTRSIRVRFSRAVSRATAENPSLWTVTLEDGSTLLVELTMPLNLDLEVEVYLMGKLPPYPQTVTISAVGLTDVMGVPIVSPYSAVLTGVAFETREQRQQMVDIRNPSIGSESATAGTIHVGSGGDYDEESGTELLRKLVFRRLVTPKGAFFHLKDFAIGLRV